MFRNLLITIDGTHESVSEIYGKTYQSITDG